MQRVYETLVYGDKALQSMGTSRLPYLLRSIRYASGLARLTNISSCSKASLSVLILIGNPSPALECKIYAESIKTIGQWLKRNQNATGLTRQMRTTQSAITLVKVSMANVLLDMKKVQGSGNPKVTKENMKDSRISRERQKIKVFQQILSSKAKQQWFSQMMKSHLTEVRAHAATLHLTLGVIDL